jgi:protein-S-isoprenylcysteine O-methyltransferase Ste14
MAVFNAYFLAGFFSFVAVFYLIRLKTRPLPRQYMGERGSSHWLGHVTFRFFRVLILAVCVVRLFYPGIDTYLFICTYLSVWPVLAAGVVLMVSGFVFTVVGHFTLGKNWVSGINPSLKRELVTHGVYSCSRNPMYIGVLATQLGFFLALPSGFTLLCLLVGFISIFNQVRLEEEYLKQNAANEYQRYCENVPRWV